MINEMFAWTAGRRLRSPRVATGLACTDDSGSVHIPEHRFR